MTIEKNAIIETTIEGIGINGEGIARVDGMTIFVPYTLPGERIKIKIVAVKKSYAFGKLINIYAPADERERESCPVYIKCGGCQIQHMKYNDQLAFKTIVVADTLKKIGKIEYAVPLCVKSDQKFGYRNKLQLPVGLSGIEKSITVGFYANNSHRIVGINTCPLHPTWCEIIVDIIKKFMTKYNISGYEEETHKGVVRHVVVRQVGKKLQITIVINSNDLAHKEILVEQLQEKFEDCSIFLNINKEQTNVVMSNKFILLAGEYDIEATDMNMRIIVSPDSFMQINNGVKIKLYGKILEICQITEKDTVIDAYSGIGTLSNLMAQHAKHIYAVEIVKNAVENAKHISNINMLENKITNILGDCEEEIEPLLKKVNSEKDGRNILILDPPRKGVSDSIIDKILKNPPDKIVYVSCNPSTLARDLGMLIGTIDMPKYKTDGKNFEIEYLQPFDMFPQTKHVETLVYLSRESVKKEEETSESI